MRAALQAAADKQLADAQQQVSRRSKLFFSHAKNNPGFVRVMENLESHGILEFHFPGLESQGM